MADDSKQETIEVVVVVPADVAETLLRQFQEDPDDFRARFAAAGFPILKIAPTVIDNEAE